MKQLLRSVRRRTADLPGDDAGMATAEYAVGTVAAAGLGGVLYSVCTSDWVMNAFQGLIGRALEWLF